MSAHRLAGAVTGALVAGAGLSALLMVMEKRSGRPSELIDLERESAHRLGWATPGREVLPSTGEQWVAQGGHMLLSAAGGVMYAAATTRKTGVVSSGLLFGAAFYAALQWTAGPLLGVKPPEWRSDARTVAMHTVNHLLFGLLTALGAKLADR